MCPNLMWRHKRGKDADDRKSEVTKLINRSELLETSPVSHDAPFQWEPHFDSSQYYTKFDSRASVFDKIMEALKDSRIDMIGVHGPGGVGKTTMVKEVAKEAKNRGIFEKIVLAVVSNDPNTSKLQGDLLLQLDINYKQTSELGRADVLRKALSNGKRKILVILDDLWQVLDLNEFGIPISGLGDRGCKILLTSRREEEFKGMEVRLYFRIGYLEEREAWELFKKVTGDFGVNESIARKVNKRCGGLPLAIVAVGATLKDEEEFEWCNALQQLENSPLKYIEGIDRASYTPLKLSYDFLKEKDAKSCFLLCCLFPEDADISIDDLVKYSFALGFLRKVDTLKAARYRVQALVKMLRRSCLLLNGKNENFVKMHDVIRDLAISITEEKQTEHGSGHDWPGQQQFVVDHDIRRWPGNDAWKHHTAISLTNNDDNFTFPCSVLDCPLVHTLLLKLWKSSLKIPNDFFQGMKKARVLDLNDILLALPSSVLELDHLRMLRLKNCQLLGDLATMQNLKNHIEILSLEGSTIKELPQEIGELTRLQSLNLSGCESLKVIPKGVISNLIRLEELYVAYNFKEWDTIIDGGRMSNASIVELKLLTQLIVLYIRISSRSCRIMVQECPDLFEKLINFNILIFDGYSYYNQSSNVLKICGIHHIDDEFCLLMDKVDKLILWKIQDLRFLPSKPQLQITPSGEGSFNKLTCLNIYSCDRIKYLFSPSCARALQQLQALHVRECCQMEQIIGDYYHEKEGVTDEAIIFKRLTYICLEDLPQFRSFYPKMEKTTIGGNPSNWTTIAESIFNEKVSFPVLEQLNISRLPVEDIWNKQAIQSSKRSNKVSFSQLEEVVISYCENLDCPKMKTFASRQLCLPPRRMRAKVGDEEEVEIIDLNAFFEFRNADSNHKMKAISWGDVFDNGEDDFDDYGKKYFDDDNLTKMYREITGR
ncbi:probable disease resistance protein At4g27220 [Diospyros lotus]|uniref:probable disease resistance protein At4g27220 n=1 Tax=Diospyros lotus TaxID=55363 RepID=UPI00224DE769|nr:probable disease resistance protein At4g27220 [Diospyros lotus]